MLVDNLRSCNPQVRAPVVRINQKYDNFGLHEEVGEAKAEYQIVACRPDGSEPPPDEDDETIAGQPSQGYQAVHHREEESHGGCRNLEQGPVTRYDLR